MTARAIRKEDIPALKRAIAIAEQDTTDRPDAPRMSTARVLSDWLNDAELLRAPDVIIPHLAIEGRVTLLSGREKIGKSTLVACAIAAASRGDDVLGVAIPASICTLVYALDEPVRDTLRRAEFLQANPGGLIINDKPRNFRDLMDALECDLDCHEGIDHVLVDTFSRVLAVTGADPNSSREVEPIVAELVDFFHRRNIAATLLYHTGKAGREYRGSTALGASVDEVLTLRRRSAGEEDDFEEDGSDDGRRLLVQDGRNLRGRVQLSFKNGVYQPYEETAEPREKILGALRDHGVVTGRTDLCKLAAVRKSVGLATIRELLGSGHIVENGKNLKLGSAGSHQFPVAGTQTELGREPQSELSSQTDRVGATGMGTVPQRPRQTIQRDGRSVVQELVPTQHGDKWRDVEAA